MPTVVATSATAAATQAFNQRKVDRNQDGTLWVARDDNGDTKFAYSKDNGATWTALTSTTTDYFYNASKASLFIDVDDYAHLVFKQGASSTAGPGGARTAGYVYYVRGTPNAGRTAWTWSTAVHIPAFNDSNQDYPDVVAHREGTGWVAHVVDSWTNNTNQSQAAHTPITITSAGALTRGSRTGLGTNSVVFHTRPTIDFHHTGDGKTVAGGTPHLYAGWRTGVQAYFRFRKAVYSAGAWTWNAEHGFASPTSEAQQAEDAVVSMFDGTRFILVGLRVYNPNSITSYDTVLYERDSADTTSVRRVLATSGEMMQGSASYDKAGNVYILGRNGSDLVRRVWDRASATYGTTVVTVTGGITNPYVNAKRGHAGASIDWVYMTGGASPYSVMFDRVSLAPDVPTNLAPSGFTGQNTVTLSATVTDPQADQVKAQFQVATDSGFTTNVQSIDGSLVNSGSTSSVAFTGTQNTTYYLRARGIDAGGNVGPYTASQTFTTNRPPTAPTVTAPNGGETYNTTHTVSWNAGSDPDGQSLVYDIDLTTDGGSTWTALKADFTGTSFTHDFTNVGASTACRIRVRSQDTLGAVSAYDESDANFTIQHNAAPTAPILGKPENGITADLGAGYTFTYTATDPDSGDAPSAWAFRRKIAGAAAYEFWNAGTGAWQSTIQWNTNPTGSVAFASGVWPNGQTYNWSVATKDTQGLEGPFAADFSVTAASTATATVTAPTGSVTSTSRPLVRWTLTQPEGKPQQTYQVRVFSAAQYGATGFDPATSTATWETAEITSSGAREIQVGTDLVNGQTYRAYVRLKAADLYTGWANGQFSMALVAPRPPVLTVTDEPVSPFGPRVRLDLRMDPSLNLLTANQASLETDTTGWENSTNGTLARTTAQALDGTASLSLTANAAGDAYLRTTPATPVVAGQVYTAVASFRAATTARAVAVRLYWFSGTTQLSISEGALSADSSAGWSQARVTAQAPATADGVRVYVRVLGAAASEVHYVDAVGLFATPTGNLVTNPDFENGTAGWTANLNGTGGSMVQSQAQTYTGRSSLAITMGSSSTLARAYHVMQPLVVGQVYRASVRARGVAGRQLEAQMWNGSSSLGAARPGATGDWQELTFTFTATTGTLSFYVGYIGAAGGGTTAAAGDVVYVDAVQVVVGSEPVDYLPPTSHNLAAYPSVENGLGGAAGWQNISLGAVFGTTTEAAYVGTQSLEAAVSGVPQKFVYNLGHVTQGTPYTFSVYMRSENGDVQITSELIDMGWDSGRVTSTGTGWQRIVVSGVAAGTGLGRAAFALRTTATHYFDAAQLEQGSVATPYVDGAQGPGFRWDASENLLSANESSVETDLGTWKNYTGMTVSRVTTEFFSGAASVSAVADGVAATPRVRNNGVSVVPGQTYTWSAWVKAASGLTIALLIKGSSDATGETTTMTPSLLTWAATGAWQRISVTVVADAAFLFGTPGLTGTPAAGSTLYLDAVQVEQRPYATAYAAPGTAHASTSTRQNRWEQGGFTQKMTYLVERSEDGGSVWEPVRDGEALPVDVQQRGVIYDYEPPRGRPVLYRAATVADV